jgi:hypothetical protein
MASMAGRNGPLQAVAIELIWRNIRGGHQRDATREQGFHQAAQQHGVGNIGDKNSSKQSTSVSALKRSANFQRIAVSLQGRQLFMDAQHKAMEVQALLTIARQALIKQVHQPGFPRPTPPTYTGRARRRLDGRFALTQQFAEFRPQAAALRRSGFILQFLINVSRRLTASCWTSSG